MSYMEWELSPSRQEARQADKPWRWVKQYEADSPAGADSVKEFYLVGIERCSHNDGLYCGGTREKHPMICSCSSWNPERKGHEFE